MLATASARSLPAFTCAICGVMLTNETSAWPESTASTAGAAPGYGMCVIFTPAMRQNSSPPRCGPVPAPAEA